MKTSMLLTRVLPLALCSATILSAQTTLPPSGPPHEAMPVISTSASADAKFAPDRATVSIAVQTRASTAAAASAENARKQTAVLSALRALGMTNSQLSTTGYSVNPEYRYTPNNAPILTGYAVTNTVLADVRDLSQVGKVLDTAVGNGTNSVSSLEFYSSNTDAPRQQAITDAVGKARADAETAARAAGGTLGPIVHLNVGGGAQIPPRPMYMAKTMAADVAPATPITPGEQTITVSVSADWRFIPNR